MQPSFESALLLMVNLVCFETLGRDSVQLHLYIPHPHFPSYPPLPPPPQKDSKHHLYHCTHNSETKISSSHQENSPHLEVSSAIGNEPQTFCLLQSLPALNQYLELPVVISTLWANVHGHRRLEVRSGNGETLPSRCDVQTSFLGC